MTDAALPRRKEPSAFVRLGLDLGPLLIYFLAYSLSGKQIIFATGIFMGATAVAMILSRIVAGAISPMLWFSGVLVLVLGGATIWLHDVTFIKIKPTIYYAMASSILLFGLWLKRPTLKLVLGAAYPGLSDRGWHLLSRNWALFFIALGCANELVWRTQTTEFWLGYKFWGAFPATILFALANVPMLMKHGLTLDQAASEKPPEQ